MRSVLRNIFTTGGYSYRLILIIFLAGDICGALIANLCSSRLSGFFTDDSGSFYLNMFLTTSVNFTTLFTETLKMRLKLLCAVIVISFTGKKKILFLMLIYVLGLCGGVVISENTLYYMQTEHFAKEFLGMFLYAVSVMPHYIMYGAAIAVMYARCIRKDAPAKLFAVCVIICTAMFAAGALSESFISPRLMKLILKSL